MPFNLFADEGPAEEVFECTENVSSALFLPNPIDRFSCVFF